MSLFLNLRILNELNAEIPSIDQERQVGFERRNAKLDLSFAAVSVALDLITGNNINHYHLLSFLVCIAGTCVIFLLTTFDGTNFANSIVS